MDERSIFGRIRLVAHLTLLLLALAMAYGGWTVILHWNRIGA